MPEDAKKICIGRDAGCDLVIGDRSVSRRHAELTVAADGGLHIVDLRSSGGTFLLRGGREKLVSEARLERSDSLRLGEYEMTVADLMTRAGPLLGLEITIARPKATALPKTPAAPKPPPLPQGRMVRCSCGTIKKRGEACPSCGL